MKKIVLLLIVMIVTLVSCNKNRSKKFTSRLVGYIYNKNDTTPFANTQFKLYSSPSSFNVTEAKEEYFYTDSKGYFDVSTSMTYMDITWPSYHEGAAYVGPPPFSDPKYSTQDEKNKIRTYFQDTLYTTPYH